MSENFNFCATLVVETGYRERVHFPLYMADLLSERVRLGRPLRLGGSFCLQVVLVASVSSKSAIRLSSAWSKH